MIDFIQNAMLWQLFQFMGDLAWFVIIAVVVGIGSAVIAALSWIRDRLR